MAVIGATSSISKHSAKSSESPWHDGPRTEHVDSAMVINTLVLWSKPLVEIFIHNECDNSELLRLAVWILYVIPFFSGNVRFRLLFEKSAVPRVSMTDFECMRGSPSLRNAHILNRSQTQRDFGDVASSHLGQLANSWRCLQLDPEVALKTVQTIQSYVELHTISASNLTDVRTCHSLWGILKHFKTYWLYTSFRGLLCSVSETTFWQASRKLPAKGFLATVPPATGRDLQTSKTTL